MASTFPLLNFPNEILLCIAEKLSKVRDCNSLAKTNKLLYSLVNRQLYRLDLQKRQNLALSWAAETGLEATAEKTFAAGASCDLVRKERPYPADPVAFFLREIPRHQVLEGFHFNYRYQTTRTVPGLTPLQLAVGCKQETIAKLLIENGADVNKVYPGSMNRCTIIHLACAHGLIATVRLLVAGGASIEARDNRGQTPIFYAIKRNAVRLRRDAHVSTLQFLLSRRASFVCRDRLGRTPLDMLSSNTRYDDKMMGSEWRVDQKAEDDRIEGRLRIIMMNANARRLVARTLQDHVEEERRKRERDDFVAAEAIDFGDEDESCQVQ